MLARAKRDRVPVAVFFIDLDNFTAVNESLGHTAGDHLLQAIAGAPARGGRGVGLTRALAGDQFVVLADRSRSRRTRPDRAQAVSTFAEPFTGVKPGVLLRVSRDGRRSPGATGTPPRTSSVTPRSRARGEVDRKGPLRRLRAGDAHGRARSARPRARSAHGARANQFFVVYQPIFRLSDMASWASRRCCGGSTRSAACRADGFVPHLEQTGMIGAVGRQVLLQACQRHHGVASSAAPDPGGRQRVGPPTGRPTSSSPRWRSACR